MYNICCLILLGIPQLGYGSGTSSVTHRGQLLVVGGHQVVMVRVVAVHVRMVQGLSSVLLHFICNVM